MQDNKGIIINGLIQSRDCTTTILWLQKRQKIYPGLRIIVNNNKRYFGIIKSYDFFTGRAELSKALMYRPLMNQPYVIYSKKDATLVEDENSSNEVLQSDASLFENHNYMTYLENEASMGENVDDNDKLDTASSSTFSNNSSFPSSSSSDDTTFTSSSGGSYSSYENSAESISSGSFSSSISTNSTTKQVENLTNAVSLHKRGSNNTQNKPGIANNNLSQNQIRGLNSTASGPNVLQGGVSGSNSGELQFTDPFQNKHLKGKLKMNGSMSARDSNDRMNVGRVALHNNTSVAEPDKTPLDREKAKNKDGLKNQMQKNAIRMIQNAVFPEGIPTDDVTDEKEKAEDSNDDATDLVDNPPKDDSPKKGTMKGTFTLKKVKIIIFIVSVLFFILLLFVPALATSRYKTLIGIDSGGNSGDIDLASGGDEDLRNLYNNINDIEEEYASKGKKFSGDLIASIYHILDSYSDTFGASDMTPNLIRAIADKMFKESCGEEDENKEHCSYGYSEELLREYLKNDLFPKYIKHHNIDSAVDEVFTYISDYANVIGNSGKSNFGGGCFIGGNTQVADVFGDFVRGHITTEQQERFFSVMGPIANQVYAETGIFASVTLAQAILEAGWGASGLSKTYNNFFGIKCGGTGYPPSTWDGSCSDPMSTQEDYGGNGNYTTIQAKFRSYKNLEESILDHGAMLANAGTYVKHQVVQASTPKEQITRIKAAGYATDANYVSKIMNNIDLYGLEKWDTASASNCSNTASGDFTTWKQSDSRWGSITIGNTSETISRVGCLVTSLAMLIQKSGVATTVSGEFNPGSFVEALNAVNGFDGANLYWNKVSLVAPSFTLVNKNVSLKGMSKSEKLSTIKGIVDQGYAAVLEVKGGGSNGTHYVAVDSVNGDTITMLDPGGHSTSNNLWKEFSWQNTSRIAYYKIS